jgi:hypothetical protein
MEDLNKQDDLVKENREMPYLKIKEDLLSGALSIYDFRDQLIELDQSDSSRVKSINNLELLRDPEVVAFIFSKNDQEIERSYKRFLGFTEFHVGQIELTNKNNNGALHIKEALKLAEETNGDDRWINYLKGTVCYLNGQKIPEEILEMVKDSNNNHKILESFNSGLKKRGYPDYSIDYRV